MINPEIIQIKDKLLFSIVYKHTISYLKLAQKFLKLIQEDLPKISENHLILFESGFEIIKNINNYTSLDWIFDCLNFYLKFAFFCQKEQNFIYAYQKINSFLPKINIDLIITNFNIVFSGSEKLFFLAAKLAKKCESLDQSLFYAKQAYTISKNCIENKLFYNKFLEKHEQSKKILGEKRLFLGSVEKYLGDIFVIKQEYKEALFYFEKAYFRFEKELGVNAQLTEKIYEKIKNLKAKLEMENVIDGMNLKSVTSPSNKFKKNLTSTEELISPHNTNFSGLSKKNDFPNLVNYFLRPKFPQKPESTQNQYQTISQNKSTGISQNKTDPDSKKFYLSRYIGASSNFITNSKICLKDRNIKKNSDSKFFLDETCNPDLSSFKRTFILSSRPKNNQLEEKRNNIEIHVNMKRGKQSNLFFKIRKENARKTVIHENKNGPYLGKTGSLNLAMVKLKSFFFFFFLFFGFNLLPLTYIVFLNK
jgi:hypothetical protein